MSLFEQPKIKTIQHKNSLFHELQNSVIFIPNKNQNDIINFIHLNNEKLQKEFNGVSKKFFLSSDIIFNKSLNQQIKYRFPRLNKFNYFNTELQDITTCLGVSNHNGGAFIINEFESEFIEFTDTDVNKFKDFINYTLQLKDELDYLPESCSEYNENIKLDKETQIKVDTILNELSELRKNGDLLKVLPIIEKYIEENNTSIDKLSKLVIDNNYNILLPDYNLEIKLSHLTKSIYFLFLENKEGIRLTDLHKYKTDLFKIYNAISYREDYDKMLISINDVIDISTNSIYVHLSRIKSAFTKVLHPTIAQHYIVYGNKLEPKKINLDRDLVDGLGVSIRILAKEIQKYAQDLL